MMKLANKDRFFELLHRIKTAWKIDEVKITVDMKMPDITKIEVKARRSSETQYQRIAYGEISNRHSALRDGVGPGLLSMLEIALQRAPDPQPAVQRPLPDR